MNVENGARTDTLMRSFWVSDSLLAHLSVFRQSSWGTGYTCLEFGHPRCCHDYFDCEEVIALDGALRTHSFRLGGCYGRNVGDTSENGLVGHVSCPLGGGKIIRQNKSFCFTLRFTQISSAKVLTTPTLRLSNFKSKEVSKSQNTCPAAGYLY
jgi:hypothetical protein